MANAALLSFSNLTVYLNRLLAWLDFLVHYSSGYILYYFFGGIKPQYHTRPNQKQGAARYAPSVVITGASEGIGLHTAIKLASHGYTVYATVKASSEIPKVANAMNEAISKHAGRPFPGSINPRVMDVLKPESIRSCVDQIASELRKNPNQPLVGLVNNAGYCMISPMEWTSEKDTREIFELDFWAYISVIKAFLPLIKQNKGRVINVASAGTYVNPPCWAPYSAVKAAIEGLSRAWRLELLPFGVGMCTIRPGFVRTQGIGPKIKSAWNGYHDGVEKNTGAVGVTSLGDVVMADQGAAMGPAERKVYLSMMEKWHKQLALGAEGAANPADEVGQTIYDALSDVFLQPNYTVGYDALLGQMVRYLVPENIYEYSVYKTLG